MIQSAATIDMKTASDLLARAQGGIYVKGCLQKRLSRPLVEKIFGKSIPTYTTMGNLRVSIREQENGDYLLFVRKDLNS